jgi:hypothetical protein
LFWAHKRPMSGGRVDVSALRRGTHAYAHVTVHFSNCALTKSMKSMKSIKSIKSIK